MNYEVIYTAQFEKDLKYYLHKKKYTKILNDLDSVIGELEKGNFLGDEITNLHLHGKDESVYKVRVVNSSIKVGKSNGFRLIYYVIKNDYEVYLLTVYSKKDQETISNQEIVELIKKYCV